MRRNGFTLLEMVVVVVLSALLASVALMSLRSPHAAAEQCREIDAFIAFEHTCRTLARRSGQLHELQFDLPDNVIECVDMDGSLAKTLTVRSRVLLAEVLVLDETAADRAPRQL